MDSGDTDLLYPLNRFYESEHLAVPLTCVLDAGDLPEPYRRLLAHQRDMTSTLEEFYGEAMNLRVLHAGQKDGAYCREILLFGADSGRVAEYGSIRIFVENFDARSRAEILAEKLPLGAILTRNAVPFVSAPRAFFEIQSDAVTSRHFQIAPLTGLFGRHNRHSSPSGESLAEIVEILAPASDARK